MEPTGEDKSTRDDSIRVPDLRRKEEDLKERDRLAVAGQLCQGRNDNNAHLNERLTALDAVDSHPWVPNVSEASSDPKSLTGFKILNECGRGGMGIVYRALHLEQQSIVAVKTLKRLDPGSLYRFKNEFRALATVTHYNLVGLHDFAFDGESWFFTMDFVDGVDFVSSLRSNLGEGSETSRIEHEVDFDRLRTALKQLTDGVLALHSANIVHRDLKPSNVLVTKSGRVVVVDFGLATEPDGSGQHESTERHVIGTAAYMAPEQAAGEVVACSADWYSVGVMLYEVLTGHLPFTGSYLEMLKDKQELDPGPPRALNPSVPPDLDLLCQGLLRRDPLQRFSGTDILKTLSDSGWDANVKPVAQTQPIIPLVGREGHLAELFDAFKSVLSGETIALFIDGNPGVGKSALVQRFLDDCGRETDAVILAGRCYERESVPFKAFDSVIDALTKYLRRMSVLEVEGLLPRDLFPLTQVFPVLRRIDAVAKRVRFPSNMPEASELRRRAFASLRELLGRIGDRRPLIIYVDDLQWGDADSAALLLDIMRGPEPPSLLMLGAYRREEAGSSSFLRVWHEKADRAISLRALPVDDLAIDDTCRLTKLLLGENYPLDTTTLMTVGRESGGNPFFIHELAEFVRRSGAIGNLSHDESFSLQQVLYQRIESLPDNARNLLEVVSVAGRPISQVDACHAAGIPSGESSAGILLRSGRLIRSTVPERDEIETYHDRVRETTVARMNAQRLNECHGGLATALEASGRAEPDVLAIHCLGAGDDERALKYYVCAAKNAVKALAFDQAAKLYASAISLTPNDDPGRNELHEQRADALANAGRGADAAAEYLLAINNQVDSHSKKLRSLAAMQLMISGHIDDGLKQLNTLFASVGMKVPPTPRRALVSLLLRRAQLALRGLSFVTRREDEVSTEDLERIDICWPAVSGLSNVDIVRGSDFQTRSLLLALRAGEPFRIARSLSVEAVLQGVTGGRSAKKASKLLDVADAIARNVPQPYALAFLSLAKGCAAFLSGNWKNGELHCGEAEIAFRHLKTGAWWELDTAHTYLMWSYQYSGEFKKLSQRAPSLLKEAVDRGDLYAATNLNTQIMTVVRLVDDRPEDARHQLQEHLWNESGFHVQHLNFLFSHVKIDLYQGNGIAAWNRMVDQWPAIKRSLLMRIEMLRIDHRFQHATCALAAARKVPSPVPHLKAAASDARQLERESNPWALALASLVRAGIAGVRNETSSAINLLAKAEPLLLQADLPHHAMAARRCRGVLVGGAQGDALVSEADAWMIGQSVKNPQKMSLLLAPGFD